MPIGKKASSRRGAFRVPLFIESISLSVCASVCMCNIRRFYLLRKLYKANFHKPGIYGSGRVWANVGRVLSRAVSRWSRSPGCCGCCGFRCVFGVGRFFRSFSFSFLFFFERTRPAASMRPPWLIYLSASNYATLSRNTIMPLWFKCYSVLLNGHYIPVQSGGL